jgi:predicted Zn-dependent protease with MMP-like domain
VVSDHLDPAEQFEEYAQNAVDSLPPDLRGNMSNVEIVVEEEPPPRTATTWPLYQGVPLTRRSSHYGGALPDKITLYRGPSCVFTGRTPTCFAEKCGASSSMRSHTTSESATSA